MALTAAERETVITTDDEDKDFFVIHTSQRPWITSILRNPAAEILEDTEFEGTRLITARFPINLLSKPRMPRGGKAKVTVTKRVMNAAKCKGVSADGKPCGRIAKKDTGFCPKHGDQA